MTATPVTGPNARLPLPEDTTLIGWIDPSRATLVAMRRDNVRALLPSGGTETRAVVIDNVLTTEQVSVWTVIASTGEGLGDGEVIVLFVTDEGAEIRDAWLLDNAEAWLG